MRIEEDQKTLVAGGGFQEEVHKGYDEHEGSLRACSCRPGTGGVHLIGMVMRLVAEAFVSRSCAYHAPNGKNLDPGTRDELHPHMLVHCWEVRYTCQPRAW